MGELVIAADGQGTSVLCRFTGDGTLLEPTGPALRRARPSPSLTVAFAPVKGDRPEWVVQKLTELGIDTIVPLVTDRSVVVWEGPRSARAVERLRRIAREAAAQSRRSWLPSIGEPTRLDRWAAEGATDAGLALADADGVPPSLALPVLAVGPEGGWSDAERALGLPSVRLGDAILRAETAAVAGAALLAALRGALVRPVGASSDG
jgi:16S rRNA (uracil1498-N3)-methyltransferase